MIKVNFNWGSAEALLEEAIDCSKGIGETGNHFGYGEYGLKNLLTPSLNRLSCDVITFIPHVHCTHSETRAHLTGERDVRCKVPEYQLCTFEVNFEHATAAINPVKISDQYSHILTDSCSVDPEYDSGNLKRHHEFFRRHGNGVVTELCNFKSLKPGLYLLRTAIVQVHQSDAHPTSIVLYPIKSMELASYA